MSRPHKIHYCTIPTSICELVKSFRQNISQIRKSYVFISGHQLMTELFRQHI